MIRLTVDANAFAAEIERSFDRVLDAARDALVEQVQSVENGAAQSWPVGPEPGGLRPGHSQSLFGDVDVAETFDTIYVSIDNQADYASFINEKGNPGRLVWEIDIKEPMEAKEDAIAQSVTDAILRAF